jgi:hypothetical protein
VPVPNQELMQRLRRGLADALHDPSEEETRNEND